MATQADVVDFIKNLKLSEVQDLIKTLEDELGVEASAPVMMGAPPAAGICTRHDGRNACCWRCRWCC